MSRPSRRTPAKRLTAQDWAQAALKAMAGGGIDAVAVEPLAASLGATKGSFYWHFADRDALVAAALAAWESQHTAEVIAAAEREQTPTRRLRALFGMAVARSREDRIEMALLATAEHPLVGPVIERVTRRRVDYVAEQYRALGMAADGARHAAVLAVSVYLGHVQLAHVAPAALPEDWERHLARVMRSLDLGGS